MKILVPIWHIKRIKTGKRYFTFNSPEASLAIINYLSDINMKYGFTPVPSDKLFRNITTNIPVSPDSITEVYRRINKKAGFKKVNNRLLIRPHSLRKLFASTLEKNDFPYIATRHILGHSVDKTTGAYFKADPESVRDKYLDVVGQVSTSAVKVVVVDRYAEVIEKITSHDQAFEYLHKYLDELPNEGDENSDENTNYAINRKLPSRKS